VQGAKQDFQVFHSVVARTTNEIALWVRGKGKEKGKGKEGKGKDGKEKERKKRKSKRRRRRTTVRSVKQN
jgi:hypothetical protein